MQKITSVIVLITLFVFVQFSLVAQDRELVLEDIMKFRHIRSEKISHDGNWTASAVFHSAMTAGTCFFIWSTRN
ncbi:MAG: hypothetical protein P1P82_05705 [Bacteroidales bacterium]|nr:hypothetical protein [Bacteroidales bacterium]MDT8431371.1 hypothetical protein [Bacteroidales bacterium]